MTIVVDSSAIFAVLASEPDAETFRIRLAESSEILMSAATYMECGTVVARKLDSTGQLRLSRLISVLNIEIVPLDNQQADVGTSAFRLFGKGSGHPAGLNFGDCFAYALARTRNLPLLFKGDDFIHTDIEAALKPT